MAPEDVYRFLITPAADIQSAFSLVQASLPDNGKIAILPHATNTIPVLDLSKK